MQTMATLKMLDYIKERYEKELTYKNDEINKRLASPNKHNIDVITSFYTATKEQLIEKNELFISFDLLSIILKQTGLSSQEKIMVLLETLQRNMVLIADAAENMRELDCVPIITFLIDNGKKSVRDFLLFVTPKMEKDYAGDYDLGILMANKEFKFYEAKIFMTIEGMAEIYSQFFANVDGYDAENVENVCKILDSFGVDDELCELFKRQLLRDMRRREYGAKEEKPKENLDFSNFRMVKEKSDDVLTDKEYKKIRHEIKQCYDFYNMELLKEDMTYEEIIDIAAKAKKIGISDDEIRRFFEKAQIEMQEVQTNPLDYYNFIYSKLEYYKNVYGMEECLDDLREIAKTMLEVSGKEYFDWEIMLQETLIKAISKIPSGYEYELSLIKQKQELK